MVREPFGTLTLYHTTNSSAKETHLSGNIWERAVCVCVYFGTRPSFRPYVCLFLFYSFSLFSGGINKLGLLKRSRKKGEGAFSVPKVEALSRLSKGDLRFKCFVDYSM